MQSGPLPKLFITSQNSRPLSLKNVKFPFEKPYIFLLVNYAKFIINHRNSFLKAESLYRKLVKNAKTITSFFRTAVDWKSVKNVKAGKTNSLRKIRDLSVIFTSLHRIALALRLIFQSARAETEKT